MHNPLRFISVLRGRPTRTHGGFGFAPPPRISRQQATMGALCIGAAILVLAAGASVMTPTGQSAGGGTDQIAEAGRAAPAARIEAASAPAASVRERRQAEPQPQAPVAQAQPDTSPRLISASAEVEAAPEPSPAAGAQSILETPAPALAEVVPNAFVAEAAPAPQSAPSPQALVAAPDTDRPDREFESVVAVADSESELAQLEAEQRSQNSEILATTRQDNGTAFNSPVLGNARVNRAVNMRARPSDDGAVLMVVPANAEIQAAQDCAYWCEVAYEGKRGFIYKSFIRR